MSTYAWPTSKPSTSELRHDEDGALVRKQLRGSDEAFAVFYRRYHKRLVGYCVRRTECEALAEDLAHDTLIRALEHLEEFDTDRPAWPWLKRIAHNAIIDHVRKHQREHLTDQPVAEDELVEDDLTVVLAERPLLAEAISELPERQQVAVQLRYVESWKSAEAGEFLDVSRPAFEQLLFRARTNLRDSYERLCDETAGRLAGLLVPVFQFKDALTARIRSRFAGWEHSLQAMGPAAMDVVGQAAATIALLGLAAAIAGGNSPASADVAVEASTNANALTPFFEAPTEGASAESPTGTTVAEAPAPEDSQAVTKRHVEVTAPTPTQANNIAAMSGHLDSEDSSDEVYVNAVVSTRLGPWAPDITPQVRVTCDDNPVRQTECAAVRLLDDTLPG